MPYSFSTHSPNLLHQRWINWASYLLTGASLILVLHLHLFTGLIAGLLVYHLIHRLAYLLARRLTGRRPRLLALIFLSAIIVSVLTAGTLFIVAQFKSGAAHSEHLLCKTMIIIDQARGHLPVWTYQYLPDNIEEMRETLTGWLHAHMGTLQLAGREAARGLAHILIGMILGAIIAVDASDRTFRRPLSDALTTRVNRLAESFRRIVFAQVKISLINTSLTALFLMGLLPLFDVYLPLAKTLIIITFIVGLLPVVGNLISNLLIAVSALSISLPVTIAALGYLIIIHKIEYLLNARIVGGEVEAKTWELLIAMLVMESAFGIAGIIAAPIYYAYLKRELRLSRLV